MESAEFPLIISPNAQYEAWEFYSFWSHPFFTGWLIVTIYSWSSLFLFYGWIKKKGGAQ